MSNCINSGINKVYILTQYNSASLNRHLTRAYTFGNGVTFGDGYVEVYFLTLLGSFVNQYALTYYVYVWVCYFQALAATQTPGEAGKSWFQGTADAVRQFHWLFEVLITISITISWPRIYTDTRPISSFWYLVLLIDNFGYAGLFKVNPRETGINPLIHNTPMVYTKRIQTLDLRLLRLLSKSVLLLDWPIGCNSSSITRLSFFYFFFIRPVTSLLLLIKKYFLRHNSSHKIMQFVTTLMCGQVAVCTPNPGVVIVIPDKLHTMGVHPTSPGWGELMCYLCLITSPSY